ncbi:ribonuclease R [Cognatilysobacter lacus]|uniref:Ribonuclease R n=1 Tax=Cognatilysobacter lacus TaxID=1643323 RepID=A0A5D8Z6S6_9GAMM|nr:ribonuclease R [Lysobacter lacus]TZF89822.1 ribonuclease R [Lysobacter lacus]
MKGKKPTDGRSGAGKPPHSGGNRSGAGARKGGGAAQSKRPPWLPEPPRSALKASRGPAPSVDPQAGREAARYERPIGSREMILELLAAADGPLPLDAIAGQLGIDDDERREALGFRLRAMLRDGQLLQNRKGAFLPAQRVDLLPGVVIANPDGFGFLKPDPGNGDDLFLPPAEMRKVMHGDRVLASVTSIDRRGRREGAIVEVLERRLTRLIGRYETRAGAGVVIPDDRRIQQDVLVPLDERNDARDGQLVVVEITEMPDGKRMPVGRVLTVLGDRLTASLAVQAAIHGHDIPHEFSPQVLEQAAAIPVEVDAAAAASRVDLRKVPLVTIDGEDAKDFDDAVWCEPNAEGFRLIVAIADVSAYVRPGTALDDEAQKRATSVYFPGFVVPMLPETLSNGICSLKPQVDRLCFVCDMQVDRKGQVTSSKFYEAVMHSHARLTYTQVWNAIGDDVTDEAKADARQLIGSLMPNVEQLHQLFQVLVRAREKRGAIEFASSEVRFVIGPQGDVTQAGMIQRNDAHKLIEECMIAANVEAARFLISADVPAPYRIHERPPEQKYTDLLEFLKEFGLRMPAWSKVEPRDFTELLKKIRDRADATLLESVLLRSQSLAVYSPGNVGHFGLALEAYAHFTSPIRRYPDLLVHRAIKHALSGERPEKFRYSPSAMAQLSLESSERSRRADEAQREVDERYRAAWMEQHIGGKFDGTISGVTSFGLFIELDESKVTGLVHVTQLPNDFYHFDPIRKTLTGERRGREYRLGDRAEIIVLKASVEDRKIDFRLTEEGSGAMPLPPRGQPAKRKKQAY